MGKVLVVSDPHFHNHKVHSFNKEGVNSRLYFIEQAWDNAVEVGKLKGCSLMLVAGDIFHIRGFIKPSVFNRVVNLIARTAEIFPVIIIPGNHDQESYQVGESAIDSLSYVKDVYVIKKPSALTVRGIRILGIPYIHEIEDFKLTFLSLKTEFSESESSDIFLIHQGIDDFCFGRYPETGLTSEALRSVFSGFIVAGHYHTPGKDESGRIIQSGSLVQDNFGDSGARGCWILDTKKQTSQFIEIESPRFLTITDGKAKSVSEVKDNYVRIIHKSPSTAKKIRDKCIKEGALSVVVQIEREFESFHEKTVEISGPRQMLESYIDIMPEYTENKEHLLSLYDRIVKGEVCSIV